MVRRRQVEIAIRRSFNNTTRRTGVLFITGSDRSVSLSTSHSKSLLSHWERTRPDDVVDDRLGGRDVR
jgi:hypothetical protein